MDLLLIEGGDGGELVKTTKDIQVIEGLENMIYLALFGGNVEASTPVQRLSTEQDRSYWGNVFLSPKEQFNSETERLLSKVVLNSSGRIDLEQAVKRDLAFMKDFAEVTPVVSIIAIDRIRIDVKVQQPGNLQSQSFVFIWDSTKAELITNNIESKVGFRQQLPPAPPSAGTGNAIVENSDGSFNEEINDGNTFVLDDTTYNVYIGGVLKTSVDLPSMVDHEINITLS